MALPEVLGVFLSNHSINPTLPFVSCLIPKLLQVPRSHCIPCILIIPSLSFPPVPSYLLKPLPQCSLERMAHSSAKSTQYSLSLNTVRSALRQQKSRCYLKLPYKNHRAYGKKTVRGQNSQELFHDISEKHRNQKQWHNLMPMKWWKKTWMWHFISSKTSRWLWKWMSEGLHFVGGHKASREKPAEIRETL